jgi:DNA invertase Pin-like site-specific DNA recombinase
MEPWIRIYARKSRALGDPESLDLLAHQINPLVKLAASDGHELKPEWVIHEVGSGELMQDRPGFLSLFVEQQRNPTPGFLYATEPARISRGDMAEVGPIVRVFQRAGVKMRTPGRTYNLDDHQDYFMFSLLTIVAHHELQQAKARFDGKQKERLSRGELLTGKPPFGYRRDPVLRRIEPDPERFELLVYWTRAIFQKSLRDLEKESGVHQSKICRTLRNPVICGWSALRHDRHDGTKPWPVQKYHRLPRDRWTFADVRGDWEPACSRETWEQVQTVLDSRRRARCHASQENSWCRDLLCFHTSSGEAKGRIVIGTQTHAASVPVYILRWPSQRDLVYPRAPVHTAALAKVRQLLADADVFRQALAKWRQQEEAALLAAAGDDPRGALQRDLLERRQQLDRIVIAWSEARDDELRGALGRRRDALLQELEALKAQLAALDEPGGPRALLSNRQIEAAMEEFDAVWSKTTGSDKRQIANMLLGAIDLFVDQRIGGSVRKIQRVTYHPQLLPHLPRRFRR